MSRKSTESSRARSRPRSTPARARPPRRRPMEGRFSEPPGENSLSDGVVFLALLRIAQDFVGLVDLLELRLGPLVPGIHVGMMLPRQPPERLPDLVGGRPLRKPERLVMVLLRVHLLCVDASPGTPRGPFPKAPRSIASRIPDGSRPRP